MTVCPSAAVINRGGVSLTAAWRKVYRCTVAWATSHSYVAASVVTLHAACMLTSTSCPRPCVSLHVERDHRGFDRPQACGVVPLIATRTHRGKTMIVVPATPRRSGPGLQGQIRDGLTRTRARSAERCDGHPHECALLVGERLVVETDVGQLPRGLAFEDEVTGPHEAPEQGGAVGLDEIEHDALFPRVVEPPPQAALRVRHVVVKGLEPPGTVTAGRLHDQDLGAQVGQDLPGERAVLAGQFDDPHPLERSRPWLIPRVRHSTPAAAPAARARPRCDRAVLRTRRRCARPGTVRRVRSPSRSPRNGPGRRRPVSGPCARG